MMSPSHHSDSIQRKWDILHTFCYAYISQIPEECRDDEEYREHRNELFPLIGNSVHDTDWKSILSAKSKMRPITLAIKHAKEFYESEVIGEKTDAYRAIERYFQKADWERQMLRSDNPPPLSLVTIYMKIGDKYHNPQASYTKKVSQKKRDIK